uniref:UDP-glucuronosyltransferase n=1 Tax=Plutella xylostella TaxID=51655 RepID=A0A1L8D6E4_PLUXY
MVSLRTISVLALMVVASEAYHVLLVYTMPGKSLSLHGEAFVQHLLKAGHEVTYVTPFPMKNKPKENFHEVDASEGLSHIFAVGDLFNISYLLDNKQIINDREELMLYGVEVSRRTLENPNVQKLLNDKTQKFDVVIGEYFITELTAGLAAYYECPMIWSYSMGVDSFSLKLVHEPVNPAYYPDYVSFNIPPLTFLQRLEELWTLATNFWIKWYTILPHEYAIYENIFTPLFASKGKPLPAYDDIRYNASLLFINTHQAVGRLAAIPQSAKLVGGHHIDGHFEPLPKDLQEIMDKSTNGVVYFSMGSIWRSATMPDSLRNNLLAMFGSLKQTVIWKFEEDIPNLPKNVHTLKWAPQHAILGHPNCLVFISHGGLGSSTEAIHFGVPTIGVPIFFDQFLNINRAISNGYALNVELSHNLHKDLKVAIETIASNPRFTRKAKELSEIYHDRPVKPAVEIPHWVRHVVRTRGAPHLRSPALMVPWYQKSYLDLLALVVLVILSIVFVVKRLLCTVKDTKKVKRN